MLIATKTHRLALLLALTLTIPLAARADEASHRVKAQEMMTLLQTQRMVKQISDNITKQITDAAQGVVGANPSPDAKAKVDDFKKQATQLIDAQLSWEAMRAEFLEVYVKNFTEEQLDGIIAFYKSPAGAALLEKMPIVNSQVTQLGTAHITALQPPMKQLFETFRKSQTAEPPSLSPSASPTPAAPATPAPKPPSNPK